MDEIRDPAVMAAVLAYCKAHYPARCHAVHVPPGSTIGGFSCMLIAIDGDRAEVEIANGDRMIVAVGEIYLRAA